jgi:dihydrofolate reductase
MSAGRPRLLRYQVATSLDGFIAGPNGEYDWIASDESFDWDAFLSQFDTLLMGRKTYELTLSQGSVLKSMGKAVVVISTTLDPLQHPNATIVATDVANAIAQLKRQPGKDIWLFGGGALFRTMLDAGLVDRVELAVSPILLGSGVPVLPPGRSCPLRLVESRTLPSGMLILAYEVAQ